MTVAELIKALEKVDDKSLEVVADIGLDFCDTQIAEVVDEVIKVEEYFKTIENGRCCYGKRKCIKII